MSIPAGSPASVAILSSDRKRMPEVDPSAGVQTAAFVPPLAESKPDACLASKIPDYFPELVCRDPT